jgi:hypothetical protein
VRRIATIVVLSVLASGSFAIPPASASAPSWPATFRGLTDPQLLPIQLDVIQRRDGTLGLSDLFVDIELTCPSGERIGFGTGVGYFPALPLDGNRVSIDEIFGNQAFHVHARVSSNRIRGTVSMALAAFTPDEQLQRCDSPIERFTAERVPETTTAAATHSPLTRTTFTVRKDGTSTRSRVVLTSRSIAAADQATSYRGKTDQHLPMRSTSAGRAIGAPSTVPSSRRGSAAMTEHLRAPGAWGSSGSAAASPSSRGRSCSTTSSSTARSIGRAASATCEHEDGCDSPCRPSRTTNGCRSADRVACTGARTPPETLTSARRR